MTFHKRILSSLICTSLLFALPVSAQFEEMPPPPPVIPSAVAEDSNSHPTPSSPRFGSPSSAPSFGGSNSGGGGGETMIKPSGGSKSSDVLPSTQKNKFAKASPEDITNENFPETIESFDFPNVEITDVIKAISELTGKNFIIDSTVRGKITIIAPSKITVAEAYKAFLSALAINGFTVVPSGGFLKIRNARSAQRDNIDTYSGSYYPNSDQMITKIIHLKHIQADTVQQQLRLLTSSYGEMSAYTQTNSLIISDFGANIDRVMKIINQLDVPGFEEQLEVVGIKYTRAKDLADLIDKVVNKGAKSNASAGGFSSGVPRFSSNQGGQSGAGGKQGTSYFMVFPDERTNSLIVVGNRAGINRVKKLISQLDYKVNAENQGGVYVYYVKHGEAEKIAQTLTDVAKDAGAKAPSATGGGLGSPMGFGAIQGQAAIREGVFGGDVTIKADKNTNSLVISASRVDYEKVLTILQKLDIPRDQVYVEGIIMEMAAIDANTSSGGFVKFDKSGGKSGFVAKNNDLTDILNPLGGAGSAILAFSQGSIQVPDPTSTSGGTRTVPDLITFLKFVKSVVKTNILSTPQITATDSQEAEIEVGDRVATSVDTVSVPNGPTSQKANFEDATIKMKIKPFISPSSERIRMEFSQEVKQAIPPKGPATLQESTISLATRKIKTMVNVNNGDTAVIGGLIRDEDTESTKKVPLLGDLPLLGWLFKGKEVSKSKINMLVFLTPRIIRTGDDQKALLTNKTQERLQFIKQQGGKDPFGGTIDKILKREARVPQNVRQPNAAAAAAGDDDFNLDKPVRK